MRVIEPNFEIMDKIKGEDILRKIELCGRVCYKSENSITSESARKFVKNIIKSGHESVLEHEKITVRIICDRGVTHEIVIIVKINLMGNLHLSNLVFGMRMMKTIACGRKQ